MWEKLSLNFDWKPQIYWIPFYKMFPKNWGQAILQLYFLNLFLISIVTN